jgi:para-aminobenzoate synthetase
MTSARTLLVDNHDSYTYNLYQLIAAVNGRGPTVLRNDDPQLGRIDLGAFDSAVVSPGPGHPGRPRDFGYSARVLGQPGLPTLGVCLGHQGLGLLAGAQVAHAPRPRHGHLTEVRHEGDGLFAGIPRGFTAVRYHSLCLTEPLPAGLQALAWAEDGVIMAVRELGQPRWGVQFHPESIASEYGYELIENFEALAAEHRAGGRERPSISLSGRTAGRGWRIQTRTLPFEIDAESVFRARHADAPTSFWLDSSLVEPGLSRFSFLGDATGPHSEVLSYEVADQHVTVAPSAGPVRREPGTIFDVLAQRLAERRIDAARTGLPFDLPGGYVGYFGYELKADCGGNAAHEAATPDALWTFADRLIAVDHAEHRTYLVAVHPARSAPGVADHAAEASAWLERTEAELTAHDAAAARSGPSGAGPDPTPNDVASFTAARYLVRGAEQYLEDVRTCQEFLHEGESYEICLTDALVLPPPADGLEYYARIRRINPAPYAALLRHPGLDVVCASPERFLRVDADRWAETKPIKGTAPRDPDPVIDEKLRAELEQSLKTRAENLMIVDLMRNDLGRVSEVGSVSVPRFMATESYATVHQLVSTIRGRLRPGASALDCVRACFPGGSMTGAPKLRTMELIDGLETRARGIYSGTIGYLGLGGAADLNIVIRTAVLRPGEMTVGAGGAIVLDSTAQEELDEMLLKAAVPLRALSPQGSAPARDPETMA